MSSTAQPRGRVTALLAATLDQLEEKTREGVTTPPAPDAKPTSTLGQLIDALDERAFGLLLLLLAIPCCIPFLYGVPQVVALPMLALTAQLALGREAPWLPATLRRREFEIAPMRKAVDRASRYLGWAERLSARRLTALTHGRPVQVVGALMLIPTASILVPLPSTNTAPGIGVAIAAVGLLERDGLLVILGLVFGLLWVGMLVFFGAEAIGFIKGLIAG
jgi:hypothetical protein